MSPLSDEEEVEGAVQALERCAEDYEALARHAVAYAKALRLDLAWFARRPGSITRIRRSLPFEFSYWGPVGHVENPFVIVGLRDGGLIAHAFRANRKPEGDQAYLWTLFKYVAEKRESLTQGTTHHATSEESDALNAQAARMRLAMKSPELFEKGGLLHV